MEQIQILITDDNDEIRASLRAYLESQEDMAVAGEAANGSEALRILSEKHVDVMLLDIIMPQLDGFGVLEQMQLLPPESLNRAFGCRVATPEDKPTNGEFISLIADKLSLEEQQRSAL